MTIEIGRPPDGPQETGTMHVGPWAIHPYEAFLALDVDPAST